jgi:hypothetical protein
MGCTHTSKKIPQCFGAVVSGVCVRRGEVMNEKIIKQVGDCKVNITFGQSNPDLKENILWAMMENYKKRLFDHDKEGTKPDPLKAAS